jgi:predicted lysophospholipase L1 biosynthesis ABC-type transport system permease subunit
VICPNCSSEKTRRGGNRTWTVYVVLIGLALVAVLVFRFNAAIVGGIMIAAVVLAHLVLNERACLDCGSQWRA